jgi:hypothetical protein
MQDLYLDHQRHAQDLRETWQARVLAESRGKLSVVVLAVLMHSYGTAMQVLLRVVFPKAPVGKGGWTEVSPPFFWGTATVMPNGMVTCMMVTRDGQKVPNAHVYDSQDDLVKDMRGLADRLQLTDHDREEMAEAFKRWVTRDLRINHLGQKVPA